MSRRPWYRWFPGDYLHDTVHLSIEEDCLYRRLLDAHWRDGNIPSDPDRIRRLSRFPEAVFEEAWPAVRPFFNKRGGRQNTMVNNRMKSLLDELNRDLTQKVNAANARWNKNLHAGAMQVQCDLDPDPDLDPDLRSSLLSSSEEICPSGERTRKGVQGGKAPEEPAPVDNLAGLNVKAWEEYLQHRRDYRWVVLKPVSVNRLQKWLVEQGDEATQAEIIGETVRNGWKGLFALKANNRPKAATMDSLESWFNEGETYEGEFHEKH